MKKYSFLLVSFFWITSACSQNVGIGITSPSEKLEVAGTTKTNNLIVNNGGSVNDFLMKSDASGTVGFKKGHGGQGLRYIICVTGVYPNPDVYTDPESFIGEVKLTAGHVAPRGWMFCEGQELPINQNQALFSLLLTNYGGNGVTTFRLPDLRAATAVGSGTSPAGVTWAPGQRSN